MSNYQEFLQDATLNKPVCMCFPRRPSLINNPLLNFLLTGYGTALEIQHIILLFLANQSVWTFDLCVLSQVSANLFRITVTWRQVDTPSVASAADVASDEF